MPITLALVEDHALMREGLRNLFQDNGFIVTIEAVNGKDALEKLEAAEVLPDVCVLDLNMPVLNGYDTLVELRKRWKNIKVLVLTMFYAEFNIIRMVQHGANGFLSKDTDPEILFETIRNIAQYGFDYSNLESSHVYKLMHSEKYKLPTITKREKEFLQLSCSDLTYKQISERMHVSSRSVESYRDNQIYKLVGVNNFVVVKNGNRMCFLPRIFPCKPECRFVYRHHCQKCSARSTYYLLLYPNSYDVTRMSRASRLYLLLRLAPTLCTKPSIQQCTKRGCFYLRVLW